MQPLPLRLLPKLKESGCTDHGTWISHVYLPTPEEQGIGKPREPPPPQPDFISVKVFDGARQGYEFRTGSEGVGYYKLSEEEDDSQQETKAERRARRLAAKRERHLRRERCGNPTHQPLDLLMIPGHRLGCSSHAPDNRQPLARTVKLSLVV